MSVRVSSKQVTSFWSLSFPFERKLSGLSFVCITRERVVTREQHSYTSPSLHPSLHPILYMAISENYPRDNAFLYSLAKMR